MRNFYLQFRDGYFTSLDVMNYIQHFKAIKMMKKDDVVLDVCCGDCALYKIALKGKVRYSPLNCLRRSRLKNSGLGREGGRYSLEFFSEPTNICLMGA